jgi:hypothetical protein
MENVWTKVGISEEIHVAIHKIRNLQVIFSLWWSGFRKIWMVGKFCTDSGERKGGATMSEIAKKILIVGIIIN